MAAGRIHTDLALETKEKFEEDHVEIRGVEIQEDYDKEKDIRRTVVKIKTENGARAMGRPQGIYITLEAPNMSVPDEDYHREISAELSRHLKKLLPVKEDMKVLVVGLGNREITPDALGPDVVSNLRITRHIIKEYGVQGMGEEHAHSVSGSSAEGYNGQATLNVNRPGFPGECFICELRLPDHRFRWKHNKLFLLLPEEYGPAFPAIVDCYTSPPT